MSRSTLEVEVKKTSRTTLPEETKFEAEKVLIGACRVGQSQERDVWKVVYADKLEAFNSTMPGMKVHANDEATLVTEIASIYDAPPPSTLRVVGSLTTWWTHYNDRGYTTDSKGYAVFTKYPVYDPDSVDQLRQMNQQLGPLMVEVGKLGHIQKLWVSQHPDKPSSWQWDPPEKFLRRLDFVCSKSGDYRRVNFNKQATTTRTDVKQFEIEMSKYRGYAKGDIPAHCVMSMSDILSPPNWSVLEPRDNKTRKMLTVLGNTYHSQKRKEVILESIKLLKRINGRGWRGYRSSSEWKSQIEESSRYTRAYGIRLGDHAKYRSIARRYKMFRGNYKMEATDAFDKAYSLELDVRFYHFILDECRHFKIPIPDMPPLPIHPNKILLLQEQAAKTARSTKRLPSTVTS